MFWFRSARSFTELSADESLFRAKQYLFDIPGSFGCYISRTEDFHEGEPYLECSTSEQLRIRLGELPDIQSWMHLTYSANFVPVSEKAEPESTSYLQLNGITVSDLVYQEVTSSSLFYAAGSKIDECLILPEDDEDCAAREDFEVSQNKQVVQKLQKDSLFRRFECAST